MWQLFCIYAFKVLCHANCCNKHDIPKSSHKYSWPLQVLLVLFQSLSVANLVMRMMVYDRGYIYMYIFKKNTVRRDCCLHLIEALQMAVICLQIWNAGNMATAKYTATLNFQPYRNLATHWQCHHFVPTAMLGPLFTAWTSIVAPWCMFNKPLGSRGCFTLLLWETIHS